MNKKILAIFFMHLILISCIGFISASDEVELEGMKFNIPDGYQFLESDTNIDDDSYAYYIYTSNDNDASKDIIINVNLHYVNNSTFSSSLVKGDNEVEKTVNGVDGFYAADTSTFSYQDGNYLVSIQAPEDLLDEIVTGLYDSEYYGSDDSYSDDEVSDNTSSMDILSSNIIIIIVVIVILVAVGGVIIYSKSKKKNNISQPVYPANNIKQNTVNNMQHGPITQNETTYTENDNLGTYHNTVEKANAYWMGERFLSSYKPPFSLYVFKSAQDAKEALLELPFIHIASDSGNLICSKVLIYGFYKVEENNYEAIICGKDLTYDEFIQTENAFKKHGGTKRNNLEPDKNKKSNPNPTTNKQETSVKFREKFNKGQYTYECYDAQTSQDALEFLKTKTVNERLYYICVYTPEGDYGRDIEGIYQM